MSTEILLGALVATEIQKMGGKFDFYGVETGVPDEPGWIAQNALTLEQFLEKHPSPENHEQTVLYGIAWEFIWGKHPPQEILDAKTSLQVRARTGMEISEMELLWLKISAVDTDMF